VIGRFLSGKVFRHCDIGLRLILVAALGGVVVVDRGLFIPGKAVIGDKLLHRTGNVQRIVGNQLDNMVEHQIGEGIFLGGPVNLRPLHQGIFHHLGDTAAGQHAGRLLDLRRGGSLHGVHVQGGRLVQTGGYCILHHTHGGDRWGNRSVALNGNLQGDGAAQDEGDHLHRISHLQQEGALELTGRGVIHRAKPGALTDIGAGRLRVTGIGIITGIVIYAYRRSSIAAFHRGRRIVGKFPSIGVVISAFAHDTNSQGLGPVHDQGLCGLQYGALYHLVSGHRGIAGLNAQNASRGIQRVQGVGHRCINVVDLTAGTIEEVSALRLKGSLHVRRPGVAALDKLQTGAAGVALHRHLIVDGDKLIGLAIGLALGSPQIPSVGGDAIHGQGILTPGDAHAGVSIAAALGEGILSPYHFSAIVGDQVVVHQHQLSGAVVPGLIVQHQVKRHLLRPLVVAVGLHHQIGGVLHIDNRGAETAPDSLVVKVHAAAQGILPFIGDIPDRDMAGSIGGHGAQNGHLLQHRRAAGNFAQAQALAILVGILRHQLGRGHAAQSLGGKVKCKVFCLYNIRAFIAHHQLQAGVQVTVHHGVCTLGHLLIVAVGVSARRVRLLHQLEALVGLGAFLIGVEVVC